MRQAAWLLMVAISLGAVGCERSGSSTPVVAAPVTAAATTDVASPTPLLHPCAMLADASLVSVVADAQPGERIDADEGVGISTCRWQAGKGVVVLQTFDAGPGALAHELSSASLELVEMRRPDAATVIPLELLDGIGDKAGAFVEKADSKRGIRKSGAVLMVQKANRLAVLRIPQLADGDRKSALASMKALGSEIAKSL